QELRLKGIDKDIIDSVISEIEIDYSSSIIDIIEKKYSGCLDDEKGRRRMFAGLMRLGFSYSDVKSALADYDFSVGDVDEY
ncbi:MAG: RecX family transcriptional regulator, partial [Clostridia bacterium]|nr:RecX family transcriptional regulator [Clostridia bacterium]